MIPSKQKVVRKFATLAVVAGIIVLAVLSAHNKNGQAETKPGRIANDVQNYETAVSTTVETQKGNPAEVSADSNAVQPIKKYERDFIYTVRNGDTLYDLAHVYGVSVDDIKNANNLTSDNLQLNQKLLIPVAGPVISSKPLQDKAPVRPRKTTHVASRSKAANKVTGKIVGELIDWQTARNLFAIGDTATVIDVNTGLSFRIKRKGGHNHADNEPLTAEDTATMKKIYGGSWSWDRRAVVLVVGGKKIAASMAGMPHGSENITNNDFSGHFDIHFKGSMTHGSEYTKSRRPVVDSQHQAMVRKAAGI